MTVPLRFALKGQDPTSLFSRQQIASTGGDIVDELFETLQNRQEPVAKRARVVGGAESSRGVNYWRKSLCGELQNSAGDNAKFEARLKKLLGGWTAEWDAVMKRKIGVALSSARPGQQMDGGYTFPATFTPTHTLRALYAVLRSHV